MYSIPGLVIGFIIMLLALNGLKLIIYDATKFSIYQEVGILTILTVRF